MTANHHLSDSSNVVTSAPFRARRPLHRPGECDGEFAQSIRQKYQAEVDHALADFQRLHGRAPRVLCIGNVANNGYNNGKLLVRAGWDCDVLCYDYYHIMGCPEWEDADFEGDVGDAFHPDWRSVDLQGFKRPAWFVQGPRHLCVKLLLARRGGQPLRAKAWAYLLENWQRPHVQKATRWYQRGKRVISRLRDRVRNWIAPRGMGRAAPTIAIPYWMRRVSHKLHLARLSLERRGNNFAAAIRRPLESLRDLLQDTEQPFARPLALAALAILVVPLLVVAAVDQVVRLVWIVGGCLADGFTFAAKPALRWTLRAINGGLRFAYRVMRRIKRALFAPLGWMHRRLSPSAAPVADPFDDQVAALIKQFAAAFPDRADQLQPADLASFRGIMPEWRRLLAHYDLVIGYATDGIYPLLTGKRPYVAYEHGTIRNIPFENTLGGRMCSITYRQADAVVITNCDNILAAERLQLSNHQFIPHPINEDWLDDRRWLELRRELQQRLQSDFILFHPSRQHWEAARHPDWEKGNDIFIRGFARFVQECCPTAAAVFVAWGKTLQQSKDLLAELGAADRVHWIEPQPTVRMTRYLRACDVIADQFYLGAFGGVMPKAMVYGRPSLIYLDEERHRWCFPEMPPVCNTRTSDEVFVALRRLYAEPGYKQQMIDDGRQWYAKYHSSETVAKGFCDILRRVTHLDRESTNDQEGHHDAHHDHRQ